MSNEFVKQITENNFETDVVSAKLAVVDFWASWCGPCRMMAPVIDALAEQYQGRVIVGKINVDEEEKLAMQFGVMTIPTIITLKNGAEISREVGVTPLESLAKVLDANA